MANATQLLMIEAMEIERGEYHEAVPFERSPERTCQANGYKTKRVKTRAGEIILEATKVCGPPPGTQPLHPNSLERSPRGNGNRKPTLWNSRTWQTCPNSPRGRSSCDKRLWSFGRPRLPS